MLWNAVYLMINKAESFEKTTSHWSLPIRKSVNMRKIFFNYGFGFNILFELCKKCRCIFARISHRLCYNINSVFIEAALEYLFVFVATINYSLLTLLSSLDSVQAKEQFKLSSHWICDLFYSWIISRRCSWQMVLTLLSNLIILKMESTGLIQVRFASWITFIM